MNEPSVAAAGLVDTLVDRQVAHHIGGSVASAAHGMGRATADVDIVADLRRGHARPLTEALTEAYYAEDLGVTDLLERARAAVR